MIEPRGFIRHLFTKLSQTDAAFFLHGHGSEKGKTVKRVLEDWQLIGKDLPLIQVKRVWDALDRLAESGVGRLWDAVLDTVEETPSEAEWEVAAT